MLAVHTRISGHTDSCISMGIGFYIVVSTNQKCNTQSSTDTDFVAVDDCIPNGICNRYWLGPQGYDVFENIVFQDNKSVIILENDGKASSSKRTNKINTRYHFITYCIQNINSQ